MPLNPFRTRSSAAASHRYNLRKRRRCDEVQPPVAAKKTKTLPAAEKKLRPKRDARRRIRPDTTSPPSLNHHASTCRCSPPSPISTVAAAPSPPPSSPSSISTSITTSLPPSSTFASTATSPAPSESRKALPSPPPASDIDPWPTFLPAIEDRDEPIAVTTIPFLTDFSCTFVRELQSNDTAAVLVVSMPDATQRILKLFLPEPNAWIDPFSAEYSAYCSLVHHGVSLPPSTSARRVVPYCYGAVNIQPLRQMKRARVWKNPLKKVKKPLFGLLLEFIPDAPSILNAPERLARRPELVADVLAALGMVHSAGVLHQDDMPRNILIDGNDGVWWIDFGCALTTAYNKIHPNWFQGERRRVKELLTNDVIPAELEGRVPTWRTLGW
ncbi:hypothetical protein FN846DRAFT_964420 [Sphaerosporella brunnea]|uniref:Protein kinase domain-containing protein n=1 Tax=Sphaerosporella brunnea TaxID=1250544 RepID=A0A5J5ENA0_9PEZI|nr:hypothetical protein FN846DRAFT_964420 [Sphaerosporella brunnea]